MFTTYPESRITKICEDIRNLLLKDEDLENSLESLFEVCRGASSNNIPALKFLNSEELILSVLKVKKCIESLKNNGVFCRHILDSLLSFSNKKDWNLITKLTEILLNSNVEDKDLILEEYWNKKEFYKAPADFVLILINHKPQLVEKELRNVYMRKEENVEEWKREVSSWWIKWCSQSPQLFQLVTSILNQFLIRVKMKSTMIRIISEFISKVQIECDKNKTIFFSLYPLKYQSFVASLIIEPPLNPNKHKIVVNFKLLRDNPSVILMLLSHFPSWIDII